MSRKPDHLTAVDSDLSKNGLSDSNELKADNLINPPHNIWINILKIFEIIRILRCITYRNRGICIQYTAIDKQYGQHNEKFI